MYLICCFSASVDNAVPAPVQASCRGWASSTSPQESSSKEPDKKDFYDHATGIEKCVPFALSAPQPSSAALSVETLYTGRE